MKKIIVIPDSFKGTLSSPTICEIVERQAQAVFPSCEVCALPVADGGEGSVDAMVRAMHGTVREYEVSGPYFEPISVSCGWVDGGQTAVIEMASCAGLPLVGERKDPSRTTTYGVGQLLTAAAHAGAKKIIVGLGGSCTNDGGCGAAAAAGVRFYDAHGGVFIPTGGTLKDIARIDMSGLDEPLRQTEIITMCDVDNPLAGERGAAYVYAPQKGADHDMVIELDRGLQHFAEILERDILPGISRRPGAGAAGAMGAGMAAFFGARLQRGIEVVLDAVRFDEQLQGTDLVITGEGRMDGQTAQGKVISGVAVRAAAQGVPVIAVVGGTERDIDKLYEIGLTAVFTTNLLPQPLAESAPHAAENLAFTMKNLFRAIKSAQVLFS